MTANTELRVRYAETDAMGIVHHAVYPVWYEAARSDFCRALGIPYAQMEQEGLLCPVVELSCRYLGTVRYDEIVRVQSRVVRLTPARVEFWYGLYRPGGERPFHEGKTVHAWVDAVTFRPVNLKRRNPAWYEAFFSALEEAKA